jgi:hypothetical protein
MERPPPIQKSGKGEIMILGTDDIKAIADEVVIRLQSVAMTDRPLMLSDLPAIAAEVYRLTRIGERAHVDMAAEIRDGTFSANMKERAAGARREIKAAAKLAKGATK